MALHSLTNDLRFALRQLRRAPGFALTAVLTLALGVGANTAIFSLLDQALLRSLPVRDPAQLVVLEGTGKAWEGHSSSHGEGQEEESFSYPMYRDLLEHSADHTTDRMTNRSTNPGTDRRADPSTNSDAYRRGPFQGLLATSPLHISFVRGSYSEPTRGEIVSGNYFTLLGVRPALGRLFTQADDTAPGANPVVVLSYDFWRDRLGADPTVVGATVTVNAHLFQVVGVAAPGFRSAVWGETPALFVPMSMLDEMLPGKGKRLTDHTDRWMNIVGRLQPGETGAEAEVALAPLWHALRARELKALGSRSQNFVREFLTDSRLRVLPGARGLSYSRSYYQGPLEAAMAMAALVLLIAAINVGSLLLVRAAGRTHEFSMRYALGARGTRIVAQLLLEGLLLGIAGASAGMLLAPLAAQVIVHRLNGEDPYGAFVAVLDNRVLAFNFAVALVVSVAFSLAPALQLRRVDLVHSMRGAATAAGGKLSFRRAIVALQIGLSVLLLVGASLFVRTMQKLRSVDLGFSATHLLTFGVDPQLAGYAPAAIPPLERSLLDRMATLPGIEAVAATNQAELADSSQGGNITLAGYKPTSEADADTNVEKAFVTPNYFSTLQVPMLAGRSFTDDDNPAHPLVAVVNQAFVRHFCGGVEQQCLARRLANGGGDAPLNIEIVGVVRDARHRNLRLPVEPTLFRPLPQAEKPVDIHVYLRTATPPAQALPAVRRAVGQLAPGLPMSDLRSMDAQIDDLLVNERLIALLAVAFGVLATVLAGVGIYGVLAYATAQRTREIGIRIALGASRLGVARLVLADVLLLAGAGIAAALPVAFGLAHLLRSQLFGISPADPVSLLAAVSLVALAAMVAALIPARRAASVDPMQALRTE